ncbi:hypothetical protein KBD71_03095 [Candidatus Woesebacteria bacterium]|nr:hypothetical protein [Candidatus Woesebacteria bacterium]
MSSPSGFDIPRPTMDAYILSLYQEYGLPQAPTLNQILPIAIGLLGSADTLITGAELTIGRRIQENDPIFNSVDVRVLDAEDRFACLLLSELTGQEAKADPKTQVMSKIYDWMTQNKTDLVPYFKASTYMMTFKNNHYYVLLTMRTSSDFKFLSLKVNLDQDTVELV